RDVVLFGLDPALNHYDKARARQLYDEILASLQAVPGVQSATMSGVRPIMGGGTWFSVRLNEKSEELDAFFQNIGPSFLETMGMQLLSGRTLTQADEALTTTRAAVINQTLAKKLFKEANPLGRRFQFAEDTLRDHPGFEVVGVVRDARYHRI